jgi:hypothetical protein
MGMPVVYYMSFEIAVDQWKFQLHEEVRTCAMKRTAVGKRRHCTTARLNPRQQALSSLDEIF